jgi:hypothetical protein
MMLYMLGYVGCSGGRMQVDGSMRGTDPPASARVHQMAMCTC